MTEAPASPARLGARLYLAAFGLAALLAYPLALLPPRSVSLQFQLGLPVLALLTLAALPLLPAARRPPPRAMLVLAVVFLGSLALATLSGGGSRLAALSLAGFVLLPLAGAMVADNLPADDLAGCLRAGGFAFWALNVLFTWWQWLAGEPVVALAGNPNWAASLLLALAWPAWSFLRVRWRPWPAAALVAGLTLPVVWACHSRAAWLALTVWALGLGIARLPSRRRRLLATGGAVTAVLALAVIVSLWKPETVRRLVAADVRLALWGRSVAMIAQHPRGVGPGNFRAAFAPYRARSRYGLHATAADVTIHPHNAWLRLAAEAGILAMLAWTGLLWPLLRGPRRDHPDPVFELARAPALILLVTAFFDMTLNQPPGQLIALFCIGLCWRTGERRAWPAALARPRTRAGAVIAGLALVAGVLLLWQDARADWRARAGMIAEHLGRTELAIRHFGAVGRIEGDYHAARLALMARRRPVQALEFLARVEAEDPAYAHINRLGCLALLGIGRGDAAWQAAGREANLYPWQPESYSLLMRTAAFTGRWDQVRPAWETAATVLRERALVGQTPSGLAAECSAFQANVGHALADRHRPLALARARALTAHARLEEVDPLLELVAGERGRPLVALAAGFNGRDYDYWCNQRLLHTDAAESPATWLGQPLALSKRMLNADRPGFQTPAELLGSPDAAGGNLLSWACWMSRLAVGQGWGAVIAGADGGDLWLWRGDEVWHVDVRAGTCIRQEERPEQLARPRLYVPFGSFFLKNQSLAALCPDPSELAWLPREPPLLRLAAAREAGWLPDFPLGQTRQYLVTEQIDQILARLPSPPTAAESEK